MSRRGTRGVPKKGFHRTAGELLYCTSRCAKLSAQKKYDERKRTARKLAKEGRTAEEIAAVVGSDETNVRKWIKPRGSK